PDARDALLDDGLARHRHASAGAGLTGVIARAAIAVVAGEAVGRGEGRAAAEDTEPGAGAVHRAARREVRRLRILAARRRIADVEGAGIAVAADGGARCEDAAAGGIAGVARATNAVVADVRRPQARPSLTAVGVGAGVVVVAAHAVRSRRAEASAAHTARR